MKHADHSPRRRRLVVFVVALLALGLVAGCSQAGTTLIPETPSNVNYAADNDAAPIRESLLSALPTDTGRKSAQVIGAGGFDAPYNYGPSVMADGDQVRMWWCSQYGTASPAGDDIVYGSAASVDGPFRSANDSPPQAVFSGNPGSFDGMHTCDPSVIKVAETYYMYYTGAAGDHALGNSIGLATSPDGVHWTRANDGQPIVQPAQDAHRVNSYGAGQPAVVYLHDWYYLMFTDTTAAGAGWNGAGQFLLRAKEPTFAKDVEMLTGNGFVSASDTTSTRDRSLVDAFSADLMWVQALNAFAIAHETADGTTLTFWNEDFSRSPYLPAVIPGPWQEGPGLLRQPNGHAPISTVDPCGRVPIDVVRATTIGAAQAPTDLQRFGIDLHGVQACADPTNALSLLDGFAMPSPVRTMDLVVNGQVIRIDRRSVATGLAKKVLAHRPPAVDQIPVSAHISAGTPAVQIGDQGIGLILADGRLWRIPSASIAALNDSTVTQITSQQWNAFPSGTPLG